MTLVSSFGLLQSQICCMQAITILWICFLVHLSRRLRCTILIMRCPSSVVRPSIVVNFSYFRLLWNRWTDFNKTWQEARSQRPLPILCFSGRSEKQDGRPGLWLAETFYDFSSETAERNSTKLDRKQDLNVLYQVCVFHSDRKKKQDGRTSLWLAETFSTSIRRNSTKLDRKQDLNVLY